MILGQVLFKVFKLKVKGQAVWQKPVFQGLSKVRRQLLRAWIIPSGPKERFWTIVGARESEKFRTRFCGHLLSRPIAVVTGCDLPLQFSYSMKKIESLEELMGLGLKI